MKRALLIAGGTVGGLGAVLAITPPQLSSGGLNIAGGTAIGSVSTSASASSSPSTTTQSSKPVATKKATAAASAAASASPTATASATPTTAATTAAAASAPQSGTFTGPSVFVNYGNVQVQITVVNGRITDAIAVKAPSGKNDRYTNMSVPTLKQQTLAAQSANIKGVSGASYTSYGWFTSLQGALTQAGL
jgi:uncharacterized protein with FMN-binding domain